MSLAHNDLKGTISPEVTIDQYTPKSGEVEDIIVVALYVTDEDPAHDLDTFIQRSYVDVITSEVSPSTDENGNYVVFVELNRNREFPATFKELIKDITRVSGKMDWEISTYLGGDRVFTMGGNWESYVALTPETYVSVEDFVDTDDSQVIKEFFDGALSTSVSVRGNLMSISQNGSKIVTEVVDIGDYDVLIEKHGLSGVGFDLSSVPYECRVLGGIMGGHSVVPIGAFIMVNLGERIALLKNTQVD